MFDLRYHVASLAAVFLALIVGILVGVGISSGGFVQKSERRILNDRIDELESRLDAARARSAGLADAQRASEAYVEESYPLLMAGLLEGERVALVFVGSADQATRDLVERALADAGAEGTLRMRALRVPVASASVREALARKPGLGRLARPEAARELGRRLAQELIGGSPSPLWRALAPYAVEEQSGAERGRADAVVVVRSVAPQQGMTSRLLRGLYEGLAAARAPAVGVEASTAEQSAVDAFAKAGLSSVDSVDTRVGRLALALLLAGAREGSYGVKDTASAGVLPPVDLIHEQRTPRGG